MLRLVGLFFVLATPAEAHGTLPGAGGFVSGALHPLAATEHLLVLLAAGLMLGRDGTRWPVAAMALGVGLGLWVGVVSGYAQIALLGAALVCGIALAVPARVPVWVLTAGLLGVGLVIGSDTDLSPDEPLAAAFGVAVAVFLISMNAYALGAWVAVSRFAVALRVAGAWLLAIALMVLALMAGPAQAHETTRSYLSLTRDASEVSATLRMAFRDVEVVVWMDENLDGAVTWAEAQGRMPAIAAYALSAVDLSAGGDCALGHSGAGVSDSGGVAYLDLRLTGSCPSPGAPMQVTSRLFADVDPDHRLYLAVTSGAHQGTAVLSAKSPEFEVAPQKSGVWGTFSGYFVAGLLHLTGGFDHIAFLLMLMLPAVTVQPDTRRGIVQVATAITGFTLAHALTLTAASTSLLRPPTDLITLLVAASIVVTALDNIRPFLPGPRAAVAAFFGLIHGFGFATVLSGSAMTGAVFATALLGFNLGIEAAQIGIAALCLFALLALRGGKVLLWSGSAMGGLAGGFWMLQGVGIV